MKRLAVFGAALLLSLAVLGSAPSPAFAVNYSLTANGNWVSNDGLLSGTWQAHFDVAGYDLSGTLNLLGMPGVGEGNIQGSWDLDQLGFGVMFLDRELASFSGGLQGTNLIGTFDTGDFSGQWSGLLDSLAFTTDPVGTIVGSNLPTLLLGRASGQIGDIVQIAATFFNQGVDVANLENLISFDNLVTPILAKLDGRPDCSVNPLINKANSLFEFLPKGCSGSACTQVRAVIASLSNLDPLPDGEQVYSCRVKIKQQVSGIYQLVASSLKGVGSDFSSVLIDALPGEIAVKVQKFLDCHCSTVKDSGPLPLASILAPLALVVIRRASRRHA